MIKNLFLMRQGKMKNKSSLTAKAKNYSQRMGYKISQLYPKFDKVYYEDQASKITAEKMLKAGGFSLEEMKEGKFDDKLFNGGHSVENILLLASGKEISRILKKLNLRLESKLGQCSVLHITLCDVCNIIEGTYEAKNLPKTFPYKNGKTLEYRERPAYYYTQSAAVPYRMKQGEIEILVITSSSGKKWVIPKGIAEPNMTPWDSAAQEALEEGGVKGRISDFELGTYSIEKWGADVSVTIYPLKVEETLSKWDEQKRKREWLSLDKACSRVTCPELKKVVSKLPKVFESKGLLNA